MPLRARLHAAGALLCVRLCANFASAWFVPTRRPLIWARACSVPVLLPPHPLIRSSALSGRSCLPSTAAWVDTGFLVALFAADDTHHESAIAFLKNIRGVEFHSIWPVVSEASFFLDNDGKIALLEWLERGPITFHEIDLVDLAVIRTIVKKYRNLSPDFTDAVLVALAGIHGIARIVTVDVRDFSAYRLPEGKVFERLWL